jgi:hypothetical protein
LARTKLVETSIPYLWVFFVTLAFTAERIAFLLPGYEVPTKPMPDHLLCFAP